MIFDLSHIFASGFRPVDVRTVPEWAKENIKIGAWSPWEGAFTAEHTPWVIEPLNVIGISGYRRLTIIGPAGGGKSTIAEVAICWIFVNAPGFTVWYAQDEDAVKEFAETRINRILEGCDEVAKFFPKNRHMKRTQALHMPHMSFLAQGANEGNAQSKHIRHCVRDETHLYKKGMLAAIDKRQNRYQHNGTTIDLSTGSMSEDETDRAFQKSSGQQWQFFCPSCQKHHVPQWSFDKNPNTAGGVKWSQSALREDGTWDLSMVEATTQYECPNCQARFDPTAANAFALNSKGRYTEPRKDGVSRHWGFHWNCLASDFKELRKIAVEFIEATTAMKRGDMSLMKEFTQKRLAESWKEEIETGEIHVTAGGYKMCEAWADEFRRFMTVDCQRDHFWVNVRAWAKNGDSRQITYRRVSTWGEIRDIQKELSVEDRFVFVDSGHNAPIAYRECAEYGWNAIKGEESPNGYPYTDDDGNRRTRIWAVGEKQDAYLGTAMQGRKWCRLFLISKKLTTDMMAFFRSGKAPGWSFADDAPDSYRKQFAARVLRVTRDAKTNEAKKKWVTVGKHGEHAWDTERYQLLGALSSGLLSNHTTVSTAAQSSTLQTQNDTAQQ